MIPLAAALILLGAPDRLDDIRVLLDAGRFPEARRAIERERAAGGAAPALLELEARCLFEQGEYPACERALRDLVAAAEEGSEAWLQSLARLGRVLALQGVHGEAIACLERALARRDVPDLRRTAVTVLLQARRYEEALPHLDALLRLEPGDRSARAYRGIALSRTGRSEEALAELERARGDPGAGRDAAFESALILSRLGRPREALGRLAAILEDDPFDGEACYQAARALLRIGGRDAATAAGRLMQYYRTLAEAEGSDSRDRHLEAAGKPVEAALARAARWRRLGALDRALAEVDRARRLHPDSPTLAAFAAGLWIEHGLLAEAAEIGALPAADAAGLEAALAEERRRLDALEDSSLASARRELARARRSGAAGPLGAVLEAARAAGDEGIADSAARLLLALDPRPRGALRHLAERTAGPELIVPHLYYLKRLVAIDPGEPAWAEALARAREVLPGEAR